MFHCAQRALPKMCGPVRADPYIVASLRPAPQKSYKRELGRFSNYLDYHRIEAVTAAEFDDLLVEWKNGVDLPPGMSAPSRSQFETTLSALEKTCPNFKGSLCFAHAVKNAWAVVFRPNHTVALFPRWASVVGDSMLDLGYVRVAGALELQECRGLRPGGLLRLKGRDLVLPEECPATGGAGIISSGHEGRHQERTP